LQPFSWAKKWAWGGPYQHSQITRIRSK